MKRFLLLLTLFPAVLLPNTVRAQTASDSDTWALCTGTLGVPDRPVVRDTLEPGDTLFYADKADFIEDGTSHMEGNVEVTQDEKQVRADAIDYYDPTNSADLFGNVNYWDEKVYLNSPTAHVNFDADTADFDKADYRLLDSHGRGYAKKLFLKIGETTEGKKIDYTTCDPETGEGDSWDMDKNFWKISASSIKLNHETDRGKATNVVLRIKDIPVFYTPYLTFPTSDKRKSGFLVPSFGTSSNGGLEFSAPYYWNIKPQMDATLTPRYISNRGLMAVGEYRYLFQRGNGQFNVEYLPSDDDYGGRRRSNIHFEHDQRFRFPTSGSISLLFNQVSDDKYLEDFGNNLATASTRYLPRNANLRLMGRGWWVITRVQDYQVVDPSIPATSRPYSRLPQVMSRYRPFAGKNRFNMQIDAEFSYFDRWAETDIPADVNGFRYDIYPKISYPLQTRATFLTPTLGLRYTQYNLGNSPLFSDSPSRLLPMASLEGGVFLDRDFSMFDTDYRQTLEPSFYYLYVPDKDQSYLPVFDTGEFSLSYSSLFRDNRFSGPDRFGDANQITLAVTSRLLERSTGREQAYIRIGQVFYLDHQDVLRQRINPRGELVDLGIPNDNIYSPVVLEAGLKLIRNWDISAELQWDPNNRTTQKLTFSAQYQPSEGKVLNLAYRVRRGAFGQLRRNPTDIDQSDISFRWPINERWSVVGRWNYAVPEGKSLDLFAGIEYESCCWGLRAVARRYLTNLDGDFQTGFFLQLQLKGLAGLGQKTVDFLAQSIPGYQSEF